VSGHDITARARKDWTLSVAGHLPIISARNIAENNRLELQSAVGEPLGMFFTPSS
jgi:hypothetical protein